MAGRAAVTAALILAVGCAARTGPPATGVEERVEPMSAIADRYVSLVLALGVHDPDYVDAYYGPPERRAEVVAAKRPLPRSARRRSRCSPRSNP